MPTTIAVLAMFATSLRAQQAFAELGLSVDLDAIGTFEAGTSGAEIFKVAAAWTGSLAGGKQAKVRLCTLDRARLHVDDPEDVTRLVAFNDGEQSTGDYFTDARYVEGSFGYVPYAHLATKNLAGDGQALWLSGVSPKSGWFLRIDVDQPIRGKDLDRLVKQFGRLLSYEGDVANWQWTDEEAGTRWREHAPEHTHDDLKIRRTEHFIILTNSSGGSLFAKKMEVFYDEIRKVFPFDAVAGQRLLPVFLFRTDEEYYSYYMSVAGRTHKQAAASKGHAWRDYYATWYESPNDPVHIHEVTHQLFMNRLHLAGGGSWFQEGVADYMSERKNTIKSSIRNQINYGEHVPLRKFIVIPSLLGSSIGQRRRGGSNANAAYLQAASIIRFLRHSKFGRDKFLDYVHAVGAVARGDLKSVESAVQRVYGIDLDEFERKWIAYWK